MKRSTRLVGSVSSIALVALSAAPALAAGTTAGSAITNNVNVDYSVGGVAQATETASDTFTVDRKVDVTVAEVGGSATTVAPGETEAAVTFQVTNLSNDTVDFDLSIVQSATDDGDITNVQYYIDDGDGIFNAGDTLVTYLDEVAADETVVVHVVGDIPGTLVTGESIDVALVADAHAGGGTGALGTELTTAYVDPINGAIDTVLADGNNGFEADNAGDFSDTDSFVVSAAALTVAKTSSILWDPVNLTSSPKAIPGAVIEYCITVANSAGSATATNVAVNDVLPADVSYPAPAPYNTGVFVDGDGACASGTASGTYNSTDHEVDGALSNIAAGVTRSLYFNVVID